MDNYKYFLQKCHKYLKPVTEILAWSLAPTHFDFLLEATGKSILPVKQGGIYIPALSNAFRILQSTYAKGINVEVRRSGNLFQQKAKSSFMDDLDQVLKTFHYIHQIPIIDGLVKSVEKWPHNSYREYIQGVQETLCNKKRAFDLLALNNENIKTCLELQLSSR